MLIEVPITGELGQQIEDHPYLMLLLMPDSPIEHTEAIGPFASIIEARRTAAQYDGVPENIYLIPLFQPPTTIEII